jgi:peroxiredoxin
MLPLGTSAPFIELPSLDGKQVKLDDFSEADALLIMFICNHCPYVRHVEKELSSLVSEYQPRGLVSAVMTSNRSPKTRLPVWASR